jgi:hypothetical protein
LVQHVAGQYPEGARGSAGCALTVDALGTGQALGLHFDGRGSGGEVILDREGADAIHSDLVALHQFVVEQVIDRQVIGALSAFVSIPDAIGRT